MRRKKRIHTVSTTDMTGMVITTMDMTGIVIIALRIAETTQIPQEMRTEQATGTVDMVDLTRLSLIFRQVNTL